MNRLLLFCLLLTFTGQLFAQAPGSIKFQAVARDAQGDAITAALEVRLTVLRGNPTGSEVYVDEQTTTPNERGLFTVNLGEGPASGSFAGIDWANNAYFLLAEIRTEIGQPYEALGPAQPLLSVPYALYGEDDDADPENELQDLTLSTDGTLGINQGNSVELGLPALKKIAVPAAALDYNAATSIISNNGVGLTWEANFGASASIVMPRPADYSGGSVTFKIAFLLSTNTSGRVAFFLRPRSYDSGNTFGDAASVTGDPVNATPTSGFGRIYEQEFTIPASRLSNDWWYISIQRNSGVAGLLTEDVNVLSTSLEYFIR